MSFELEAECEPVGFKLRGIDAWTKKGQAQQKYEPRERTASDAYTDAIASFVEGEI
jgi:hypothetical protein